MATRLNTLTKPSQGLWNLATGTAMNNQTDCTLRLQNAIW